MKYVCGCCGKEFHRLPCQAKNGNPYCSRSCATKANIALNGNPFLGKKHSDSARKKMSEARKLRITKPETREKLRQIAYARGFNKLAHGLKGKKKSMEMRMKLSASTKGRPGKPKTEEQKLHLSLMLRGRMTGEAHHNWKHGKTKIQGMVRATSKYVAWRSSVFQRDNWTCKHCGLRGGYVEAHHKESLISILIKHDIKTLAQSYDCCEIWDISNGETLCVSCHNKTKTGRPKRNKPQCEESILPVPSVQQIHCNFLPTSGEVSV